MRKTTIDSEDSIRDMIEELSDKSRMNQEKTQHMATTDEAMVELCQQFTDTNLEQGKQITKLIIQI